MIEMKINKLEIIQPTKAWKCNFHRKLHRKRNRKFPMKSYEIVMPPMKLHKKLQRKMAPPGFRTNRYETIRSIFYLSAEGYSCNHAEWVYITVLTESKLTPRKGQITFLLSTFCHSQNPRAIPDWSKRILLVSMGEKIFAPFGASTYFC